MFHGRVCLCAGGEGGWIDLVTLSIKHSLPLYTNKVNNVTYVTNKVNNVTYSIRKSIQKRTVSQVAGTERSVIHHNDTI